MPATVGNYQEQLNQLYNQSLFEESTVKKHRLGTVRVLDDGRVFVYVLNGATATAAGLWYQGAAGHGTSVVSATVPVAHPVGTKAITLTESGSASGIALNACEDGFLVITAGSGIGQTYKVRGNAAIGNSASGTVYLYDGLATAWNTTTTKVALYRNPYRGVVVGNASGTSMPLCIAPRIYSANTYFWGQIKGWAGVVCDARGAGSGDGADEKTVTISPDTDGYGYISNTNVNIPERNRLGVYFGSAAITDNNATLVWLNIEAAAR